jgi:hypothetical protein
MTQHENPDEAIDKAWSRIQKTEWDQMNWFVKLANTDLSSISEGDLLNWKDEFRAMCQGNNRNASAPDSPPSSEDMAEVQTESRRMLWALAQGREIHSKRVLIHYSVLFQKTSPEQEQTGLPRYQIYRGEVGEPQTLFGGTLCGRLTQLLEKYANNIRQCPHCQKLFLQVRSDGRYCSRRCHSVAGMRMARNPDKVTEAIPAKKEKQLHPKKPTRAKTRIVQPGRRRSNKSN